MVVWLLPLLARRAAASHITVVHCRQGLSRASTRSASPDERRSLTLARDAERRRERWIADRGARRMRSTADECESRPTTWGEALTVATHMLARAGVSSSAQLDAVVLLGHVVGARRAALLAYPERA